MITNIETYLSQFYQGTKDPTLNAMKYLAEKFNHPENLYKVIHIAGTNGKGSTTEMFANVLQKQGYIVGKYISPHLIKFNERICVNQKQIEDKELLEILNQLEPVVQKCEEHFQKKATFFEVTTMVAFIYFAKMKCDFVVLETGLGGTYDCTNIVKPEISIITSIGYDHMKILGNSLEEIAENKAGIIKQDSETIMIKQQETVNQVFIKKCKEKNNKLHLLQENDAKNIKYDEQLQTFDYQERENIQINLKGKKQIHNALLVIKGVDILKEKGYQITEKALREGLKTVIHKARFEKISEKPTIIYDGAHNEEAILNFQNSVKMYAKDKKRVYIFSALERKEYNKILKILLEDEKATFIFHDGITENQSKDFHYVSHEELRKEAVKLTNNKQLYAMTLEEALQIVNEKYKDAVVFIVGSFYLYGTVIEILNKIQKRKKSGKNIRENGKIG